MREPEDGPPYAGNEPALEETQPLPQPPVDIVEDVPDQVPGRGGCRTDLRGWAGAHLHGAVRPRRRAAGRGRPPSRWC
jgi:hypothetical protein